MTNHPRFLILLTETVHYFFGGGGGDEILAYLQGWPWIALKGYIWDKTKCLRHVPR